jgi:hypothetical protein
MMSVKAFLGYVASLPEDCIEVQTSEETRFHLPRKKEVCPACGSDYMSVDSYYAQRLRGLPDSVGTYIYNRRRYRCNDCGKTFAEQNPFLASWQRTIGNRLRQIRAQKKITQGQVVKALNIPLYLYKKYEADDAEVPPTLVAMQIADYLGTDVLDIWGDQIGGGNVS